MTVTVTKAPRKLGGSSLSVFPVGLGCMSLSGTYGKSDDAEAIKVVHHALERGVNFLDSSDMYGWGHNESLLGKALAGRRDKAVLATKEYDGALGKWGFDPNGDTTLRQATVFKVEKGAFTPVKVLTAR